MAAGGEVGAREAAVRALIDINPVDAWAHQELSLILGSEGRLEEALAESEIAGRLDPTGPGRWCVHGQVCTMAGQLEEARDAYRQAIQLSADTGFAIWALVAGVRHARPSDARRWRSWKESWSGRRFSVTACLPSALRHEGRWSPEELLATLRKGLRVRPDLWHAWSAVTWQLMDMDRLDEALHIARQATARFPLLPRLWLDLAKVCEARADRAAEKEALQQALRISPGWGQAIVQLASLYERTGEFEQAKQVLEQAVMRTPWIRSVTAGSPRRCGGWRSERPRCNTWSARWSWSQATSGRGRRCSGDARELEGPEAGDQRAAGLARRLATRRPGEARSWLVLAQMLAGEEALAERLAALDRAIELRPRLTDAYEMKAELLAEAGGYAEALAACAPEVWGDAPPSPLRARAAMVEAERGNIREAVARLQTLVADDPQFYRGWMELARCYEQTGAVAEYLEVAQKMVQLEPQNPVSFAILADARLRAGDRRGAKTAFGRASDLDPDYAFAGMSLFDMQLEDEEFDPAARTLERLSGTSAAVGCGPARCSSPYDAATVKRPPAACENWRWMRRTTVGPSRPRQARWRTRA